MTRSYAKGYAAEREILHKLHDMGYAVLRAPHSGSVGIASPDIVAIKNGRVIVLECKSHRKGFTVRMEQLQELQEWEQRAGANAYIAWKISRKGWHFLKLKDVLENNGNVGFRFLDGRALTIDEI
jgi:holliday junction resolvase Hjr